jgi:hypothetical protein
MQNYKLGRWMMSHNLKSAAGQLAGAVLSVIIFGSTHANAETPQPTLSSVVVALHSTPTAPISKSARAEPQVAQVVSVVKVPSSDYMEWDDLPSYIYAEWSDWSGLDKTPSVATALQSRVLPIFLTDAKQVKDLGDLYAYTYLEWNDW